MMTIEELAAYSCVKESTVRDGLKQGSVLKVPGAYYNEQGQLVIPNGSRWPYNKRNAKLDTREKRKDALLEATYHNKYVDASMLNMPEESFHTMISELVEIGLLRENGTSNKFGANAYDTTCLYDQVRSENRLERIKQITNIGSAAAGSFCGAYMNQYYPSQM